VHQNNKVLITNDLLLCIEVICKYRKNVPYGIFEEETSNFSNQQIVTQKFTKELFKLFEKNCGSFFNLFSKIKIY
jgi:hypothetical protein